MVVGIYTDLMHESHTQSRGFAVIAAAGVGNDKYLSDGFTPLTANLGGSVVAFTVYDL